MTDYFITIKKLINPNYDILYRLKFFNFSHSVYARKIGEEEFYLMTFPDYIKNNWEQKKQKVTEGLEETDKESYLKIKNLANKLKENFEDTLSKVKIIDKTPFGNQLELFDD